MFICNQYNCNLPKQSFFQRCLCWTTEDSYNDNIIDETETLKTITLSHGEVQILESLSGESIEMIHSTHNRPKLVPTGLSASTITTLDIKNMTHPLSLPDFIPAKESFDASDFTAQSFLAKLRSSGVTVMKHGRCACGKSKYRTLYIHVDKRSLTWRPAPGEPPSRKKKASLLDLSTCIEVRHGMCQLMYFSFISFYANCRFSNESRYAA